MFHNAGYFRGTVTCDLVKDLGLRQKGQTVKHRLKLPKGEIVIEVTALTAMQFGPLPQCLLGGERFREILNFFALCSYQLNENIPSKKMHKKKIKARRQVQKNMNTNQNTACCGATT